MEWRGKGSPGVVLIKLHAPVWADQTKAVEKKGTQSAALNTKKHLREDKRQIKSPGFIAETHGRIEKWGSLQFRAVVVVMAQSRSPSKAWKPQTSATETEKWGRCKSLWAKLSLKGLEVKSHEKEFSVEWWGKEKEITDTCQWNKV